MNIRFKTYPWLIILIMGVGMVGYIYQNKLWTGPESEEITTSDLDFPGELSDDILSGMALPLPSFTHTPVATPRPSPSVNQSSINSGNYDAGLVQTPVPASLITGPALCQLSGSIDFLEKNLYETRGAKIAYQNVDDSSRLIFWKYWPNDEALKAGPNIFSDIKPLPNGEARVGVSLYKDPTAKSYDLTASITYGVKQPDGSEKMETADCNGKVIVYISF